MIIILLIIGMTNIPEKKIVLQLTFYSMVVDMLQYSNILCIKHSEYDSNSKYIQSHERDRVI